MVIRGERLNGFTHLAGALASIAGLVWLVVLATARHDPFRVVGCAVFGASLILLYAASTTYHTVWGRPKRFFQKIDHAAIYLLIAGTYTPYTLVTLHGGWRWSLFGLSWTLAAIGIAQELWLGRRAKRVSVLLYLGMGWLVVIALGPLSARLGSVGLVWLLAGGLAYTGGVAFYLLDGRMRHAHAIWHLFVLGGSTCHFFGILRAVA